MPFGKPDIFEIKPAPPKMPSWAGVAMPTQAVSWSALSWQNDEVLKKAFGVEWAKNTNEFTAACIVFPNDTSASLWASKNWLNDQIVIEARDTYQESGAVELNLLDKEQLAAKLLQFSDETTTIGNRKVYVSEAKDRLKALELYSEIMGFLDKANKNTFNNFVNNEMKVVLVKPEVKEIEIKPKHIEHKEQQVEKPLPFNIKLVSAQ